MATANYSYQTEHPAEARYGENAYSANTFSHGYTPDTRYTSASSEHKHRSGSRHEEGHSSRRHNEGQSSRRRRDERPSPRHSDSQQHRSNQSKDRHSSSRSHQSSHADKEQRHRSRSSGTEPRRKHRSDRQSREDQNHNGHSRHDNACHADSSHGVRGEAASYDEMAVQLHTGAQPPARQRRDNRHDNYNRYSQSTAFIPAAWDFANNRHGLVGLITQICTDIDNRVCPSAVSVVDDPNAVFNRGARGVRSLPQGAYAQVNTNPAYVRCPKCKRQVRTRISREIGTTSIVATAAAAAVVVAVNAPAAAYPLAALPLQLKMFKRKVHICPECQFKMGRNVTIHIPE